MRQYVFLILIIITLFSTPIASLIKNHYDDKAFQCYKNQYNWLDKEIYDIAKRETKEHDVKLSWMLSIWNSESQGNRYAVSVSGAIGIGQIMPFHYKGRKEVLFDPNMNLHLSCAIFKDCLDRNKGNLIKALNAYERGNKREDVNVKYLSEIIENIYYK